MEALRSRSLPVSASGSAAIHPSVMPGGGLLRRIRLRPAGFGGQELLAMTAGRVHAGYPSRHCEPTGRANARPMTGSAKQSMPPQKESVDCRVGALLAMTGKQCGPLLVAMF